MEQNVKVSVVLPNHNGGRYLKKAIKSVLNQTYQNLELIIVDDCSSDDSAEIIQKVQDPRVVRQFETVNRHVAFASNVGIRMASGVYIARMDSDDIWEPQKLEKQVAFMEQHPEYGACFTRVHLLDKNDENADEKYWNLYGLYNGVPNKSQKEWIRFFFKQGNCLCNPSCLIRKSALDDIGGFHNLAYVPGEDYELWARMVLKYPIHILEEPLTNYRWTEDEEGKISGHDDERRNSFINVYLMLRNHYLDLMTKEQFVDCFAEDFQNSKSAAPMELEWEKVFLLLSSEIVSNDL